MLSTLLSFALLAGRSDVVLVTIDTLRADHVGAYGSTRGATPVIDALALGGVVVEEAVVQVPLTRPSHTSIMTGLLPFQHGIRDNTSSPLARNIPTLASTLKAAGYDTAAFIGAYPVSRGSGLDRGFDVYDDPFFADTDPQGGAGGRNERSAREVVGAALAWLARPSARPRFVWVHLFEPHSPYEPPSPFDARFRASRYDGEVATADHELNRLFDAFPAGPGRLVVVTSDHGEGLGDHGEDEHHLFVYDSTLRVPLIVAGVGLSPGRRVKGQFRSIDLMPTILELVAVPSPQVTGVSRAMSLKSGVVIPDNESYAESLYGAIHFGYAPVRALRAEGFKYIDTPKPELYRVATDTAETANLNLARAPLSAAMQKRLRGLHGEDARRQVAAAPLDPAAQERLASLGYAAGGPAPAAGAGDNLPDPKDRVDSYRRYSRGVNAALLARRRDDPEGVVKVLAPIASEFATQFSVGSFLGEALLELRRFNEAIPPLTRACEATAMAWPWGRLAEALAGANRPADALVAVEKGLAISPTATTMIRQRAALLTRTGRGAEAVSFLERASAASPRDGVLLAEIASIRRIAGDLPAAESLSGRAVTLAPNKADVWLSRGLVLAAIGRSPEAGQAFARSIELDSANVDALFYAATIEIQAGHGEKALGLLDRVQKLDPGRAGLAEVRAAARASGPARPNVPPAGAVRLLLIRCPSRDSASDVLKRVAAGEDFSTLARTISVDPSASSGGDLGWVRPGDLREPLGSAARGLAPGAVSPILDIPGGFVILKRTR